MFYIDFDGNEINYRFTDKNNFFVDFQSFLIQKPSRYYWQAMQDSELFILSYNDGLLFELNLCLSKSH